MSIAYTSDKLRTMGDHAHIHVWANMANADVGDPVEMPGSADRSVQVTGTFGAGGNLRILGSNDGVNYSVLTDPQGNALDFTSSKIEAVIELTRFIKPQVTAGDGTTSLTVSLLVKK